MLTGPRRFMSERPDTPNAMQSRSHPRRLPPEAYQQPDQPVCFTICTRDRRPFLNAAGMVEEIVAALDANSAANGCQIIAYCVMPDHVHIVASVGRKGGDLLSFVEGFKRGSGIALRERGITPPIWQRSYWDRHVRDDEDLAAIIEYILANPVRKGLCKRPDEWPHAEFRGYPWA